MRVLGLEVRQIRKRDKEEQVLTYHKQETFIEFKHLPDQCGSMVLVMDTAFNTEEDIMALSSREILCNFSAGDNGQDDVCSLSLVLPPFSLFSSLPLLLYFRTSAPGVFLWTTQSALLRQNRINFLIGQQPWFYFRPSKIIHRKPMKVEDGEERKAGNCL